MQQNSTENLLLERMSQILSERAQSYETGVQTSLCSKTASDWSNLLTKIDFVAKGEQPPVIVEHKYSTAVILRRLLRHEEVATLLKQLWEGNTLEMGQTLANIPTQARLSTSDKTRRPYSEWSSWPADIFTFEPPSVQPMTPDESLLAADEPYYPSLGHVLSDLFGFRVQHWRNYLRGQIVLVLPDYRARISKLTIALASLRAEFECRRLQPTDLVVKVFAENSIRCLLQRTLEPQASTLEIDLNDRPSLVSLALISKVNGETLHEKTFREGVGWIEPDVIVEDTQPEIEHLLLTGESETVEFKEKLDKGSAEKVAKTIAAFANTKGGTIVFGVDDDHNVVGCKIRGMADTVTNIIRSYCDPPPVVAIREMTREDKQLLLVQVSEGASTVHLVKNLGLFIRANGTNRAPTSHELHLLLRRRGAEENGA